MSFDFRSVLYLSVLLSFLVASLLPPDAHNVRTKFIMEGISLVLQPLSRRVDVQCRMYNCTNYCVARHKRPPPFKGLNFGKYLSLIYCNGIDLTYCSQWVFHCNEGMVVGISRIGHYELGSTAQGNTIPFDMIVDPAPFGIIVDPKVQVFAEFHAESVLQSLNHQLTWGRERL